MARNLANDMDTGGNIGFKELNLSYYIEEAIFNAAYPLWQLSLRSSTATQ